MGLFAYVIYMYMCDLNLIMFISSLLHTSDVKSTDDFTYHFKKFYTVTFRMWLHGHLSIHLLCPWVWMFCICIVLLAYAVFVCSCLCVFKCAGQILKSVNMCLDFCWILACVATVTGCHSAGMLSVIIVVWPHAWSGLRPGGNHITLGLK